AAGTRMTRASGRDKVWPAPWLTRLTAALASPAGRRRRARRGAPRRAPGGRAPAPPAQARAALPVAAAAEGGRDSRWRHLAFAGYALHLFTVFGLALSNILLGLTLALAPRALAERRVRWQVLQPVLLPMGFYLVFLTASILLSYD